MRIILITLLLLVVNISYTQSYGLHSIDIEPQAYRQEIGTNIQSVNNHFYLSLLAECRPEGCPHLLKVDTGMQVVKTYFVDSLFGSGAGKTLIGNNTIIYASNKRIDDQGKKVPMVCQYGQSLMRIGCTELADTGYVGVVQIEENRKLGYTALIMEAEDPNERRFMRIVELSQNFEVLRTISIRDTFKNLTSPEMVLKEDGGIAIAHIVELKTFVSPFKSRGCITTLDSSWTTISHEVLNGARAILFTPKIAKSGEGYVRLWYRDSFAIHNGQSINVWPYLQKIDNKGNVAWTLNLLQYWLRIDNLEPSKDGGVIGCGYASEENAKSWGWIFKISKDGRLEWDRKFLDELNRGGLPPRFRDIVELDNGKIAATGMLIDSFEQLGLLDINIALLVTDSNGCITPGCQDEHILVKSEDLNIHNKGLRIFPNPSAGKISLETEEHFDQVVVYNLEGHQLVNTPFSHELDLSFLDGGTYILLFKNEAAIQVRRVVIY